MTCYHCCQPRHMRRYCPRRQRSHGTAIEHTEQPDMQGTVLLLHVLARLAFKLDASNSFLVASCVIESGLEVEAFREAMCGCSSLGGRVRVDRIGRDYELEISEILLRVDPRNWGVTVWHHCVLVHGNIASSMVWSFTTLGECGLGLSLGLRPMKTHSSNWEIKSN